MLVMGKKRGDSVEVDWRASCVMKEQKTTVNYLGRHFLRWCVRLLFQRLNGRGCAMVDEKSWFLAYFKRVLSVVKG